MDLGRDPRWPRMWESYGEDCYVNAQMAVEAVKGFQGENPNQIDKYHVATSLKHFMGYVFLFQAKTVLLLLFRILTYVKSISLPFWNVSAMAH